MAAFTEKAIIDTFVELLNKKSLDKITIKDLVDECGINRSTFYYYFEDIYDLLEKVLKSETEKAITNYGDYQAWVDGFLVACSFALENKRAIYHIYNSINRELLQRYLNNVANNVMKKAVDSQSEGHNISESDKQLIADIYRFTLVGMVLDWLEGGMKTDAVEKIKRMSVILDGHIQILIERAEK